MTSQVNRETLNRFYIQVKINRNGKIEQSWTINDREENNKVVVRMYRASHVSVVLKALNKEFGYLD